MKGTRGCSLRVKRSIKAVKYTTYFAVKKDLKKDRRDLEKKERELMAQLRNLEKNGEHYKARLVAKQIASYRAISDRNFEADTLITTRAQTMLSDHIVNRSEVEAIKVAFINHH